MFAGEPHIVLGAICKKPTMAEGTYVFRPSCWKDIAAAYRFLIYASLHSPKCSEWSAFKSLRELPSQFRDGL